MKQLFPIAKFAAGVLIALMLSTSCAKLPQQKFTATSASERPIAENVLRININHASAPELERLPGVGKVIAERIIEHREKFGPFRRAEHLMMVRGISGQKFRELRSFISVE